MAAQKPAHVAVQAMTILRSLYQLSTDLHASENRQELIFRILNSTIGLFPYRRAVLWSFAGKKTKVLGISGREEIDAQSSLVKLWGPVVESLKDFKVVRILNDPPNGLEENWKLLVQKTSGLSAVWIPIRSNGAPRAGVWLERWGSDTWDESESEILNAYAQNLRSAWKRFDRLSAWQQFGRLLPKKITIAIGVLLIAISAYIPLISLRVVAPCEIVPKDPTVVAAPVEGVIKEVKVKPGDFVKIGDPLFVYDERIATQNLKVAQKQVEIVKSQYDRMRFRSFMDDAAMEEIQSLKYRIEQEKAKLKLAESTIANMRVYAETDGVCMVDHPENWQGRPVQVGERVIILFQSDKSKVRIYLPEKDNIEFNWNRPIGVILNIAPTKRYKAYLKYIAPQASKGPNGNAHFLAEALFSDQASIKVGSQGTAVIYGEKVSLIYWILRKPMASVRQFLGV